jgi:iron complex outermembrane receptor protein
VWALFGRAADPDHRAASRRSFRRATRTTAAPVGATFDPQARIRIELTDWLALRGGAGTTFRGPPPQNLYSDLVILTFIGGAFRAVDVLGDPDLEPESATTYNAGVLIDSGGFQASADYWRYDFDGPIESEPVSGMVSAMFGASGTPIAAIPATPGCRRASPSRAGSARCRTCSASATYAFNAADVSTSGSTSRRATTSTPAARTCRRASPAATCSSTEVDDVVVEGITVQPAFDAAGLLNYQTTAYPLPQLKGQAWLQALIGDHSLRLQLNHVDGYTDQRGADVFGPNTARSPGASVTAGKEIGSLTTVDLTWRWSLFDTTTVSLALVNLFDRTRRSRGSTRTSIRSPRARSGSRRGLG